MMAKTRPTSVRFDEEQLTFFMEKEGIATKQKAVDFLLNQYWWARNIGVQIQELPTYAAYQHPDPPAPKTTKQPDAIRHPKTVAEYLTEISNCEFPDEYKKLWSEIASQPHLTEKQKSLLKLNMNQSHL